MTSLRPPEPEPVLQALRRLAAAGPVVVAHRGSSLTHPENTLPAFADATALGVAMQEFDVQETADGGLVCLHDECCDRTTDAPQRLGPGALVAQLPTARVTALDAGSWKDARFAGTNVPTLEQALAAMLPRAIPMIEHKGGAAATFVEELRRLDALDRVLLQSFDWDFVAAAGRRAPGLALGLLGPNARAARLDATVVAAARSVGAGLVHWDAAELRREDVERAHAADLLVCTYTSDDELAWFGGRALGVDAMCTNDPARILRVMTR